MASPKYRLGMSDLKPTKTNAAVAGVGSFVALVVMLIGKWWPEAWANDAERVIWEAGLMFVVSYIGSLIGKFATNGESDQKKTAD